MEESSTRGPPRDGMTQSAGNVSNGRLREGGCNTASAGYGWNKPPTQIVRLPTMTIDGVRGAAAASGISGMLIKSAATHKRPSAGLPAKAAGNRSPRGRP